jgi:hypothetical protein
MNDKTGRKSDEKGATASALPSVFSVLLHGFLCRNYFLFHLWRNFFWRQA